MNLKTRSILIYKHSAESRRAQAAPKGRPGLFFWLPERYTLSSGSGTETTSSSMPTWNTSAKAKK